MLHFYDNPIKLFRTPLNSIRSNQKVKVNVNHPYGLDKTVEANLDCCES